MNIEPRISSLAALTLCALLTSCGGGSSERHVNTDYSALKYVDVQDSALQSASDATLGLLLKNGVRLSLGGGVIAIAGTATGGATAPVASTHSDTTVQVEGVDEGDSVKYDGNYIYALLTGPSILGTAPTGGAGGTVPAMTSTTLKIIRTDSTTASMETVSRYALDGSQGWQPVLYRLDDGITNTTQYIAVVSQVSSFAVNSVSPISISPILSMHTVLTLLDVSQPENVSRAWKMEMDGYLRTSRRIGDTLYLVSSFSPTLAALNHNATTDRDRQANERLILAASTNDLLPHWWDANGVESTLLNASDCYVPTQVASTDAFRELTVITAINLRERRITDTKCASIGEDGVYVSPDSIYIGGTGARNNTSTALVNNTTSFFTVLDKFALQNGTLEYRATGAVDGIVPWTNSSYFMDEYQGDLRIATTFGFGASDSSNHLSVLRETTDDRLTLIASLPNTAHPESIGKTGEQIRGVRFAQDRGYVVTFRITDPLYAINLQTPTDPFIAGALQITGFSTYLRPLGSGYLLGVGQDANANGIQSGVKVQLFDVRDLANPQSVGAFTFGRSWSDATWDPHALTFLSLPGPTTSYRMAMHLDVYDTPMPTVPNSYSYTFSGLHLFEIDGLEGNAPQLQFHGVLTAQTAASRSFASPIRSVLHDDSVFYIFGDKNISSLWQNVPAQ